MKKYIMGILMFIMPSVVYGQNCATPPSCETLGYTKTAADCSGKTILKCPFDNNKVYCDDSGGSAYEPKVGDIYYADGTYDDHIVKGKKAIGVVGAKKDNGKYLVFALENKNIKWSDVEEDVSCLQNVESWKNSSDKDGKNNTECLLKQSYAVPAAEYCGSYKTEGTKAGDWFLPSMEELSILCENISKIEETYDLLELDTMNYGNKDTYSSNEQVYTKYNGTKYNQVFIIRFHQDCYSSGYPKTTSYPIAHCVILI